MLRNVYSSQFEGNKIALIKQHFGDLSTSKSAAYGLCAVKTCFCFLRKEKKKTWEKISSIK